MSDFSVPIELFDLFDELNLTCTGCGLVSEPFIGVEFYFLNSFPNVISFRKGINSIYDEVEITIKLLACNMIHDVELVSHEDYFYNNKKVIFKKFLEGIKNRMVNNDEAN